MLKEQNPNRQTNTESVNEFIQFILNDRSRTVQLDRYDNKQITEITMECGYTSIANKLYAILSAIECVSYATEYIKDVEVDMILPPLVDIAKDLIPWPEFEMIDKILEKN